MSNILKGKTVYMAGAIEKSPDEGRAWRYYLEKELSIKFGMEVFNPLKKSQAIRDKYGCDDENDNRADRKVWKEEGEYELLQRTMAKIAYVDLLLVGQSDLLIVYLQEDVAALLTYFEMAEALTLDIPVLVVYDKGKKLAPDSLFSMIDHRYIFSSFDELLVFLDKVNSTPATELG